MIYRSLAFICMAAFYAIYFSKMLTLKKRGILKDGTLGKNSTKEKVSELILKTIMIVVPLSESISVILGKSYLPIMGKVIGVYLNILAVFLLLLSCIAMKNSWIAYA